MRFPSIRATAEVEKTMTQTTVADTLREYQSLLELLDDAYWEASSIQHKDMLYDIISILSQEVAEINKLSVQDHHFPYEVVTEGMRRVVPKLERLDEHREDVIQRTQTLTDFRDILSSVLGILEAQLRTM
jgi:RNA polymerase-interacting CarD/CdnL/TRCF family regulator